MPSNPLVRRAAARRVALREAIAGKVVAVTGGARGIGYRVAGDLLAAGARVVIGDIDADAVGKSAAELGIDGLELDVTRQSSIDSFLDEVIVRHGRIDVLINNAGIMPVGAFLDSDEALIRRTIDIDLVGVMLGTRAAAKRMVSAGGGQIVNIASVAGRLPNPGLALYNGAKAGVIEFSEALDNELADRGVRVSTVMPTFTNTGLISGLETNRLVTTVEPEAVSARVLAVIARPKVRVAAPATMRFVDVMPALPIGVKRRLARIAKTDSLFLRYDATARAEYDARIGR